MPLKLGKKPAREGAITFRFARYFDKTALPTPPKVFGRYGAVHNNWEMLANDAYGDCVWAGAAHETILWRTAQRRKVDFDDKGVLSDYAAATGFNPRDPLSDNGTDMQEAASYRRKTGILDADGNRHKVDAYAAIEPGDVDTLMLSTYLFGAAGVGIRFPVSAEQQFDAQQPWDVVTGSRIDGGHYIPVVGRNSAGHLLCVTWGRLHAMTVEFFKAYCDEAIAYISVDWLNNDLISPRGYDLEALKRDLAAIRS